MANGQNAFAVSFNKGKKQVSKLQTNNSNFSLVKWKIKMFSLEQEDLRTVPQPIFAQIKWQF
jgi:hypothetical protein